MPIFRPTARVRLQLSLDEGANAVTPTQVAPVSMFGGNVSNLGANLAKRAALAGVKGVWSAPQLAQAKAALDLERETYGALSGGESAKYPGGVDPSKGSPDRTVVFDCLPATVTIVRAPSKDADTASVTLAFRDAPIDPRCVRSCSLSIALGAVSAEDYAAGMVSGAKRGDGSSLALVDHENEQELKLWSTTRFTGYSARWKIVFDEGGDMLQLECVDMSCVMRAQPLLGHHIDLTKPIDEGVRALIDEFATSRGMRVVLGTPIGRYDQQTVQVPTGKLVPADVMPAQLKTRRGKVAQASVKSEKQTVWDHIVDVTLRLGLVPVMRGFTLYLVEPRLAFRDLEDATRMVYGRNVKHLEITRKMEGITTDTIEVRSPDRSVGRVRWARYPVLHGEPSSGILGKPGSPQPVTTRSSKVSPNGTGHETVRVLSVRGIAELATLEKIAEATFHEMGRQEIQGQFSTDEIDSFETRQSADLLDLMPGQAVSVLVEQQDGADETQNVSTLQSLQSMSVGARKRYLQGLGISPEASQRLAEAQEQSRLLSTFRASYVTIRFSVDEGVSVECDFYNFVVIREDPNGQIVVTGKRPSTLGEATSRKLK